MQNPLRYMGSKRALAPRIASLITELHPGATVADAFAGTCAIGTAAAPRHRVIANDLHKYAEVIARALLVVPGRRPRLADAREDLQSAYEANLSRLRPSLVERIREEQAALSAYAARGEWRRFVAFSERELSVSAPRELQGLPELASCRADPSIFPYSLFSRNFAGTYFGVEQAATIDSLRYAIDGAPVERRDFYLLALLHAVSFCGAAPGHFAQFLVPRDGKNVRQVTRYRTRHILGEFQKALNAIRLPDCLDRLANRASHAEASDFLHDLTERRVGNLVIYADPPYSRAQYSRYYHVLETLVLYDYPEATGKGRYRADRVSTGFSRAGEVVHAMSEFVVAAASTGAPLFLSYPENGLLSRAGADLQMLLSAGYSRTRVITTKTLAHSTMGGAPGTAAFDVRERVYYAWNP